MFFFFFNDTATTEIYTLSLHDALPISKDDTFNHLEKIQPRHRDRLAIVYVRQSSPQQVLDHHESTQLQYALVTCAQDRKSTRLNSSHANISYAVFCLKKKKYKYISYSA